MYTDSKPAPRPSLLGRLATANADKLWQRKPPAWAQASFAKAAAR